MNDPILAENEGCSSASAGMLRGILGFFGVVVMCFGIGFAILLFVQIIKAFKHPDGLEGRVDQWEQVLRGKAQDGDIGPDADFELRIMSEGSVMLTAPRANDDAPTTSTASAAPARPIPVAKLPVNGWRVGAIVVMVLLLTMLVRISIWMIKAGAETVASAFPKGNSIAVRPIPPGGHRRHQSHRAPEPPETPSNPDIIV